MNDKIYLVVAVVSALGLGLGLGMLYESGAFSDEEQNGVDHVSTEGIPFDGADESYVDESVSRLLEIKNMSVETSNRGGVIYFESLTLELYESGWHYIGTDVVSNIHFDGKCILSNTRNNSLNFTQFFSIVNEGWYGVTNEGDIFLLGTCRYFEKDSPTTIHLLVGVVYKCGTDNYVIGRISNKTLPSGYFEGRMDYFETKGVE